MSKLAYHDSPAKLEFTDCDLQSVRQDGLRRPPYAFTQEGIAMLSSVSRSGRLQLVFPMDTTAQDYAEGSLLVIESTRSDFLNIAST